jgi:hypothetical protein
MLNVLNFNDKSINLHNRKYLFDSPIFYIVMLYPKYHIVTVTIVTLCDSVWWRLKSVTMHLILKCFKSLVLASSFLDFLWRPAFILQNPSHCDGNKCDHFWQFCDSLKAVTKKTDIECFKSPSLAGFFVTICDLIYYYTSTSVLNRLTYIGYWRTNNYQKHILLLAK